ncbi:MAG: hypothetical protein QOF24_922 [Verrucomicrobiota bacterium]|jgi:hypothetical protein
MSAFKSCCFSVLLVGVTLSAGEPPAHPPGQPDSVPYMTSTFPAKANGQHNSVAQSGDTQRLPMLTRDAKAAPYVSTVERMRGFHRVFSGDLKYYISSLDTKLNGDTTSTVLVTVLDSLSETYTFQLAPGSLRIHFVKNAESNGNSVKLTFLSADTGKDEVVAVNFTN